MQKKIYYKYTFPIIQIMRISIILGCFVLTSSLALASLPSYGQAELEKTVKVSFKDLKLKDALEQLQKQTNVPLAYNSKDIPTDKNVNYSSNKKVKYILEEILTPYNLKYEVKNGFVRLSKSTPNSASKPTPTESQQAVEIRGAVTDTLGMPLAGVSISLKTKPSIGTTTDLNGKYMLTVPRGSIIVYQSMGYKIKEETVGSQSIINVSLQPTQAGLDEVVVVGFGTQKKISLVGAQSTVNAKDLQVPVANLSNSLAGRLPGVVSVQRTGEPGFDDAGIYIRGISTFSQGLSAPLVLVDGAPRKMANVDPEDIESFTVLKDAAATAVYGVRGANGVIIIKTKNGKPGKPKFSMRYYEGLTQFTKTPEFADGITYMHMANEALTNRGAAPLYSEERIRLTQEGADPYLYPNVDWMNSLFNKFGHQRRGNLNVSGGSDRVNYYVATNYFDELGLYKQDDQVKYNQQTGFKRYSMTTNLSIKASELTKIDLGIQGYLANANYPGTGQATIFGNAFIMTPVIHPIKYENGYMADQRSSGLTNPYGHLTESGYANQWRNQLFSNLRVTQDLPFITKGLSMNAMFSFDVYNYTSMRREKRPDTYLATGRDENGKMLYEQTFVGERFLSFNRSSNGERTIYVEGGLNYARSFGKHATSGMLLFNKSDRLDSQASNFINSLPFRYLGLSGRATYAYDDRYFLEANFGYNGSENFEPSSRYGFFPSFALGWVLSEESFFGSLKDQIQLAKVRFSHGKVGNSQIAGDRRFAYISTISEPDGYVFGKDRNNSWKGHNIGEYGVDVTWETAIKSNLGFDIQTKNNALNIQFDLFQERREGIFLRRGNVPSYVGLQSAPYGNLGIIENKGFDGAITYNKKIRDFSFQIMGNITFTKNKVIENDQPNPMYPWLDKRGLQVNQRFGLVALGLFETEDEINNGPLHAGTVKPGDIRFQDTNGDGKIDDFDRVPMGYGTIPQLVYGFGLTVGYKNFSLSSLFQGVGNVDIHMNGEGLMPFAVSMSRGNLLSNIEDRWTIDNPRQDAFYPRLSDGKPNNNYGTSTWWIKNGKYVRLKDLQLTYNLPKKWINPLKIENANIFAAGYNVFTWSPFKFWDVELGDGRGSNYPNISSYSFGVNVNF